MPATSTRDRITCLRSSEFIRDLELIVRFCCRLSCARIQFSFLHFGLFFLREKAPRHAAMFRRCVRVSTTAHVRRLATGGSSASRRNLNIRRGVVVTGCAAVVRAGGRARQRTAASDASGAAFSSSLTTCAGSAALQKQQRRRAAPGKRGSGRGQQRRVERSTGAASGASGPGASRVQHCGIHRQEQQQ